ncbi:hypothetical protein ACFYW9_19120 [Streptomyces sp. NPDC002698]|uniref:hypothetical protein n=1 Tax=Streptomyces sp. NPDC002698 TaxID=3364660 RepID=UPI00369726E5
MRNPRIRRGLVAAVVTVAALMGAASFTPEPAHAPPVSSFNDGFADSKQDDCDQGFQPACDWLANNH